MKSLSATSVRNRFGEFLDLAQSEPVRITHRGRDIAVVMSPNEFRRLAVARLHAESASRWSSVYEALAK